MWDTIKAVSWGIFIPLNCFIRKNSPINDLSFHLKKLEKVIKFNETRGNRLEPRWIKPLQTIALVITKILEKIQKAIIWGLWKEKQADWEGVSKFEEKTCMGMGFQDLPPPPRRCFSRFSSRAFKLVMAPWGLRSWRKVRSLLPTGLPSKKY